MISILPDSVSMAQSYGFLVGAVGPRPIALASTVDERGRPNLSPFSYFNIFSANPPILIFSPVRRVSDNTTKHTLQNVLHTMEVVINIVNYEMVQQMSLSSAEYPKGTNEFKKSGLTMLNSDFVKPYRVAESPVQFECKVTKVEALGKEGGAGNLIFSEVVKIHVHTDVLDENGNIEPHKIDQVARMGGNWYSRANKGLFEVQKPLSKLGVGFDAIPAHIRESKVLTGNDLGMLANVEEIPDEKKIADFVASHIELRSILSGGERRQLELKAQDYLKQNDILSAWKTLLAG
ncbi:MAG TPA: flavin reductase family protein [Pricia antarctica]|uniref:Flavin reductase family protein n=2 Tax=root TaxID=1 RepID=A0A831QPL9_9FLAO|nr:flavin reductase family protein [Pricia antarctica]